MDISELTPVDNQNQQSVPMEELAQVSFNKDIAMAMLMKQNKDLNQQVRFLTDRLSKLESVKKEMVQPDTQSKKSK